MIAAMFHFNETAKYDITTTVNTFDLMYLFLIGALM